MPEGLPGPLDVRTAGARQARDDGSADHFGDRLHRLEVALGGDGEAGLNNVYAEAVELMRQPKLFLLVHAAAGKASAGASARPPRRSRYCGRLPHRLRARRSEENTSEHQ